MPATKPFKIPKICVPLERCYWVVEHLLLAGAYPGHPNSHEHTKRISGLWEAGMRTFINLMNEEETDHAGQPFVRYDDVLRELASKNSDRIAHLRFPVPDTKITTHDRMRSILDAIDLSLDQKTPVYVHCFGGMARTGTVICCWLLRHGLASKDNVLSLLTTLRQADLQRASWPAPENKTQCQFVLDWPEGQPNAAKPGPILSPGKSDATVVGNWFERLFGFTESDRNVVYNELEIEGNTLRSKQRGTEWTCGKLEIRSLADLRRQHHRLTRTTGSRIKVSEVVGDAKAFHADSANAGALFQVASQFNLLEMVSPSVTPEQGITIYEHDPTQGPACAVACGAGTIQRNYFVELDGQIGQTARKQVDCLAAIGQALGNVNDRLWKMKNGYALPSAEGLQEVDVKLSSMCESELDYLQGMLKIGLQWDTQVTMAGCEHLVTQAYCSALPVAYSGLPSRAWERFARLILEAAYEATFAAAVLNLSKTGNHSLYLTLLGGGAFGNDQEWIMDAIRRAVELYRRVALDVKIVSFRHSNPAVRKLCDRLDG
ncbi:MAG: dual specificity protein phosphatase family protein [Planctomycetaceae bacterium]|nr:dual specificity protein phosphatase family protein [Planctomycetaceae bacterium]